MANDPVDAANLMVGEWYVHKTLGEQVLVMCVHPLDPNLIVIEHCGISAAGDEDADLGDGNVHWTVCGFDDLEEA
jgi:hypothetical protein